MEKLIRVIRLHPGEGVLILSPEEPPMLPGALLLATEPSRNDDADGVTVLLRVV